MATDLLANLNPQQQRAVTTVTGPVLVLAGPGSGKTRVLTHRIAYLITEAGIDPLHILAVTFTNKAAREMRERLVGLLGEAVATDLTVGTFHAICARWLRRDIIHLGRERDFVIYDSDDQERLMKRVLRELNLNEKQNPPRAILGAISQAKNELVGPEEFARHTRSYFDEVVARCYARYQALLRESNALDFDDLLGETVRLFREHPAVLAHYQQRYRFLMVDEYQDTNRAQYLLVRALAERERNLFVVGDEAQSIYAWRGADIRNILQFERDYPDATVIMLEQNYRSTQAILDAAQALINASPQRKYAKRLWTTNGKGEQVILYEAANDEDEASFVVGEILRLIAEGAARPGDCAIMYRTNAQSRLVEEALVQAHLPYHVVGGVRFYERKEVKDVLAYLRLAANPYDSVSLQRVINWPGRGIGERTVSELIVWARQLGVPLYQALSELAGDAADHPFAARARSALLEFYTLIADLNRLREMMALGDLIDYLLARVEVQAALKREYDADEADDRWRNVQELRNAALAYANLPVENQLAAFLEDVALIADVDSLDRHTDVVTCITLHQAKGLEFPYVFVLGIEEGLLPHSRSQTDRDSLEEERRLLYVGMTRAQRRLYLCHAGQRALFGRVTASARSRFLADIPPALFKPLRRRGYRALPAPQPVMFNDRSFNQPPARRESGRSAPLPTPLKAVFFPGQRVRHATFGEGIVVSSRLIEGDEEVTVRFPDRERRLLASFARLEPITDGSDR
ncbi:DNA helicase UvrD [Chloroflexus islandicus]|uniref:DNA 3'-5' helicase n=1 Tax=Chloroflexus islandicus TaxID=1707952 RepID=A0A178MH21_9CHLR|nr:UvrD-helicase domain-containing protein [Chloroflexus islandicus]OAN47405.1 DNA helicase UvrD [Chloroflexus islandicus]